MTKSIKESIIAMKLREGKKLTKSELAFFELTRYSPVKSARNEEPATRRGKMA